LADARLNRCSVNECEEQIVAGHTDLQRSAIDKFIQNVNAIASGLVVARF
jgi:hypothetical protein